MQKTLAIGAAAAAGLFLAGVFIAPLLKSGEDAFAACRASAIAGGSAAIGGPFTLVNGAGETVTDQDVMTKPSLVYFGYTFCPDACPLDMARNAEALDLLVAEEFDAQGVFISIDPERDTPEVVAEYTDYMHEDMVGLTGSLEQVSAASRAYKTYFKRQPSEDEFYLVDHSTQTYLMLPEHGFVEFFKQSDSPEKVARTASCYIKNAS